MVFIKRVAVVLMTVIVFACAGQKKPEEAQVVATTEEGGIEKIVALPNPYLAVENKAPKEAVAAFNLALESMQANDWPQAQQRLEQMTETFPELSGPWVNLGIAHWRQEAWDAAEAAFTKASEVNPLNNDAYVQFAVMQRERGKFEEAEQLYLKALQVWPHNMDALINLGILYDMYMGRFNDALTQFELAQKLSDEPNRELDGWIIDIKRRQSE